MIAGRVEVMFSAVAASIAHLRSGALRALAVTTAARIAVLPDVATLGREVELGLSAPDIGARIADLGSTPLRLGPAAFGAFLAAETEKWGKIVRISGARPD
jgi:tripartite-type tricarboxylate transporter receptor subunit TctC